MVANGLKINPLYLAAGVAVLGVVLWVSSKGASGVGRAAGGAVVDLVTGVLGGAGGALYDLTAAGGQAISNAVTGGDQQKFDYWNKGVAGSGPYPGAVGNPKNIWSL